MVVHFSQDDFFMNARKTMMKIAYTSAIGKVANLRLFTIAAICLQWRVPFIYNRPYNNVKIFHAIWFNAMKKYFDLRRGNIRKKVPTIVLAMNAPNFLPIQWSSIESWVISWHRTLYKSYQITFLGMKIIITRRGLSRYASALDFFELGTIKTGPRDSFNDSLVCLQSAISFPKAADINNRNIKLD